MKKLICLALLVLVLPSLLALNLKVDKLSKGEVMIAGTNTQTAFNLSITNLGTADYMEFYNLLGFQMFPVGAVSIGAGQTKFLELKLSPLGEIKERGYYTFKYFIKGSNNSEVAEELTFKIIDLEDAFTVGSGEVDVEKNTVDIYIQNKEKIPFENIKAEFKSGLFTLEKEFDLAPEEKKVFTVALDEQDIKKLSAGFYTLTADLEYAGAEATVEGTIKFSEIEDLDSTEQSYGWLIRTDKITKVNQGNVNVKTVTSVRKNILELLFTTIYPAPDVTEWSGATVYYSWEEELKPGETLEVTTKTNYLVPILISFLVVVIVVFLRRHFTTDLVLRKKINFVHSKSGELVLKVSILVKAKRYIENVNILDRLPALVRLHPRFGGDIPARADEKKKRVEWNFEKLEANERRIMSYVIYSKIGVLGKFALPPTTAIYEKNGKIKETESNKAYFVAEERDKEGEQ